MIFVIQVDVAEYCQRDCCCPCFSPDVEEPVKVHALDDEIELYGDYIIRCKNRKLCESLIKYLKEGLKNRGKP